MKMRKTEQDNKLAQLTLFLGSISISVFRNWLMLYVGTHLSITIISDFLKKMIMSPIKFFDTKLIGDFQQRIQDNHRIEDFLTSQSMITFFSIITFSVFFLCIVVLQLCNIISIFSTNCYFNFMVILLVKKKKNIRLFPIPISKRKSRIYL